MYEAPWWLGEPPASMPLPWSGEVIPIEEVPPIPPSVPIAGPVIQFIGEGEHAVWDDVFNWIKKTALPDAKGLLSAEINLGQSLVKTVESYIGSSIAALSGFINDAFDYTSYIASDAFGLIEGLGTAIGDNVIRIDKVLYGALEDIIGIDRVINDTVLPGIYDTIVGSAQAIDRAVANVEAWGIDNIYTPLDAKIWGVGVTAEADIADGLSRVLDEARAYADAHAAEIAAAIAAVAAAAAAATAWIDDCGEPMCEVQGPKTDLGKILKGLGLALDAALFADLANAKEGDVADAITRIATKASDIIGTFERDFLAGNSTLAGTIGDELKQLV